jgi:leucyl/phenylalanyl-tRNA--protein transferase
MPLDGFHLSRSLARRIRQGGFMVTLDHDFSGVVTACAERQETWISHRIQTLYEALHKLGHAHSIEVWDGDALIGGVYGVTLGAAFFGESMFSRRTDASKIALAYAVHHLRAGGFRLFDTQFLTPHLASLGGVEIPRADYRHRLEEALMQSAQLTAAVYPPSPSEVVASLGASGRLQDSTQTS